MNRLMIVARLRDDAHDEAEVLLREGPPFEPESVGLERIREIASKMNRGQPR